MISNNIKQRTKKAIKIDKNQIEPVVSREREWLHVCLDAQSELSRAAWSLWAISILLLILAKGFNLLDSDLMEDAKWLVDEIRGRIDD